MPLWVLLPPPSWTIEGEPVQRKLLSLIGRVINVDANIEEVSKRLFARVPLEVDISKPIKMEYKYIHDGLVQNFFIDYKNITNTAMPW